MKILVKRVVMCIANILLFLVYCNLSAQATGIILAMYFGTYDSTVAFLDANFDIIFYICIFLSCVLLSITNLIIAKIIKTVKTIKKEEL